jgi:hypothetical protein
MRQSLSRLSTSLTRRQLTPPTSSPIVYLPEDVATSTAQLIASYGDSEVPHEGIAYWAGVSAQGVQVITTVLAPEATTTKGSYRTSVVANAMVIATANRLKLQILAQIHGHPRSRVDHSVGDDNGAFMPYTGFYSLVVPHYGRQGMLPLHMCGIHRYEDGGFVRLAPDETEHTFVLVPTSVDLRS